jgi:LEA14-like dessication related protein
MSSPRTHSTHAPGHEDGGARSVRFRRAASLALVALAFAGVTAACSKPVPPTLVPVSAEATEVTLDGITLSLTMNATNPNANDLSGQGFTAHVVLNSGVDLGTATASQPFSLPAGKTTPLEVPVQVKWSSLAAIAGLAQRAGDIPYTVDGTATMGGALVNVGIPFHLAGVVTHTQLASAASHSIPGLGGSPVIRR